LRNEANFGLWVVSGAKKLWRKRPVSSVHETAWRVVRDSPSR